MKRFEIVNGDEYLVARDLVRGSGKRMISEPAARQLRSQLVERVVEPIVRRDGRRAVHLAAVALDDSTINLNYGRRPEGSEPIVLDLRTKRDDVFVEMRRKVEIAPKQGLFDRIRAEKGL